MKVILMDRNKSWITTSFTLSARGFFFLFVFSINLATLICNTIKHNLPKLRWLVPSTTPPSFQNNCSETFQPYKITSCCILWLLDDNRFTNVWRLKKSVLSSTFKYFLPAVKQSVFLKLTTASKPIYYIFSLLEFLKLMKLYLFLWPMTTGFLDPLRIEVEKLLWDYP